MDGMVPWSLGRRKVGRRCDRLPRRDLVRPRRRFPQRRASRCRKLHADESLSSDVRGHHRGSQGLYPAMEDQFSSLSADGKECPALGIQMRTLYRRNAVWPVQQTVKAAEFRDGGTIVKCELFLRPQIPPPLAQGK